MTGRPLTLAQVADLEHVSLETVRRAVRAGDLPALVVNPHARRPTYRVTDQQLDSWRALRAASAPRAAVPDPQPLRLAQPPARDPEHAWTGRLGVPPRARRAA